MQPIMRRSRGLLVALLLVTALLQLLFAIISFSGGRMVDALQQTGVAAFFFVLAAGCVVVARYASNQEK